LPTIAVVLRGPRGSGRRAAAQGFVMHDEIETVFERFEIVCPPEIADIGKPGDVIDAEYVDVDESKRPN